MLTLNVNSKFRSLGSKINIYPMMQNQTAGNRMYKNKSPGEWAVFKELNHEFHRIHQEKLTLVTSLSL